MKTKDRRNEQTTLAAGTGRTEPEKFFWNVKKIGEREYQCSCPRCGRMTPFSENGKMNGKVHYCLVCGAWLEDKKGETQ